MFLVLFLAHLHRFIYYGDNPNYYGFGFILMILIPRVMYFNQFKYQQAHLKRKPEDSKNYKTYDLDKVIWETEVSLRHFFGYYLNFIGIFMPPIATFIEYRHFIMDTFPYKCNFRKMTFKYVSIIIALMMLNQYSPKFWDFKEG